MCARRCEKARVHLCVPLGGAGGVGVQEMCAGLCVWLCAYRCEAWAVEGAHAGMKVCVQAGVNVDVHVWSVHTAVTGYLCTFPLVWEVGMCAQDTREQEGDVRAFARRQVHTQG